MNVLKKSLLVSTALLLGATKIWAMEDPIDKGPTAISVSVKKPKESAPKPTSTELTYKPVAESFSNSGFFRDYKEEERERYRDWRSRYSETQKLTPDVATLPQHFEQNFGQLKANEKPLTQRGEIYLEGGPHKKAVASSGREEIAYVGPTHMNYLQRGDNLLPTYEAFAVPQVTDPKIDKGAYGRHHQPKFIETYSFTEKKMKVDKTRSKKNFSSMDTDIVFDPGHGIDHAITITHNNSNSTADVRNYTPQNSYYNRSIRNFLVQEVEEKGDSYKELAIYAEHPLLITRKKGKKEEKQPIPEGFIFFTLDRGTGNIKETYYFPNFHHYKQEAETLPLHQVAWKFFAKKYQIKNDIAALIWGYNEISNERDRRIAQSLSGHVGYRALSGRFEVLPEHGWSPAARNALVRTAAIYRIEKAAEYDATTENMLEIARMFNDKNFSYPEFKGSLYVPHLARYWVERALKEVERKNYTAKDVSFFMLYELGIPIEAEEMSHLISSFEQQLMAHPQSTPIVELLRYFNEHGNEDKYRQWTAHLSQLVGAQTIPGSIVINDKNYSQLGDALSDTDRINIILDFEITLDNVGEVIEGFKQRAIREMHPYCQGLAFLEITRVSPEALSKIFQAFEEGIDHNNDKLCVDVRETA
ncbi:MAG: hypothetical protein K2Y08_04245, partial [Alphaproteobacteria bacterium]|nr:hypothetical protein [Alphaproteobacteria bacterium]